MLRQCAETGSQLTAYPQPWSPAETVSMEKQLLTGWRMRRRRVRRMKTRGAAHWWAGYCKADYCKGLCLNIQNFQSTVFFSKTFSRAAVFKAEVREGIVDIFNHVM